MSNILIALDVRHKQNLSNYAGSTLLDLLRQAGFGPSNYSILYVSEHTGESLSSTIQSSNVNLILTSGEEPLRLLTGKSNYTKQRGSVLSCILDPSKKVIPTWDYLKTTENYVSRYFISYDLRRASVEAHTNIFPVEPNLIIEPSFDTCMTWLMCTDDCAFDIEIAKGELDCFSLCFSPTSAISIPFYKSNMPYFSPEQEVQILSALSKLLGNPNQKKIMQNGIFDSTFMYSKYNMIPHNVGDTMIAMRLLYPDFPAGLDFISSIYTNIPYYKDDGKERWKGFSTNDHAFWRYSALDAYTTYVAHSRLMEELKRFKNEKAYETHINLLHPLMFMQDVGVMMNEKSLAHAREDAGQKILALTESLNELTGTNLNPSSTKQLAAYFYSIKGYPVQLNSSKKVSTDIDAMKKLIQLGSPEAQIILDIRKYAKLKSTYYNVKLDNGFLKCSYNPIGANTGRLSSSKTIFGFGTNRQNQPKSMRSHMFARPYRVPYTLDLVNAETRIVANLGPIPAMQRAFQNGIDVYVLTASMLFGIPFEQVSREPYSAGIQNSAKSQRDLGKFFVLSAGYGIGFRRAALKAEIRESIMKPLLERYHSVYPEIKGSFQSRILNQLRDNRTLTNCLGRKRKFFGRFEQIQEAAFAFPAQSLIADIIAQRGLTYIYEDPLFKNVYLFDQVHDSISFEIPLETGWQYHEDCIRAIQASLEQPLYDRTTSFSIPAEFEMARGILSNKHTLDLSQLSSEYLERTYNETLMRTYITPEEIDLTDIDPEEIEDDA